MKIETVETMLIKALKECLEEIPFLQLINVSAAQNAPGLDFRMDVRLKNRPLTILVEYKSSGQPRLARNAALQINDWLSKGRGDYGIFTAPYISPQAAAICKEAGIGYLDLAGNCLLSFETVYVLREGKPNPAVQRREMRSLYSPKAERILRTLLGRTQQSWKTEALAEAAQVSFGQVANVKKYLADREWLAPGESGIRLNNPAVVLDEWAAQYRFSRNVVADYYALAEVSEREYDLAEACQREGMRCALTAFSGAARLAPAVRYQRAVAYVDGDFNVLTDSLGWKAVTSGANVSLLIPYDEGVFFENSEVGGIRLVTPIQIYLDLQNYRGRGQEAAQAIRKVIELSW
jgi:transcriptional regulator with XRE-family HTH domain